MEYARGNDFIPIPETREAVNSKIFSLLTIDVKTEKLIRVSRETIKEAWKRLKIEPK